MITVTFHHTHYLEDDVHDGDIPRDDVRTEVVEVETPVEAAILMAQEGLSFKVTGTDWAADPDGSYILNYATGECVETTGHVTGASEDEFNEIVRLLDE